MAMPAIDFEVIILSSLIGAHPCPGPLVVRELDAGAQSQ
jgi:hypothetical protein